MTGVTWPAAFMAVGVVLAVAIPYIIEAWRGR